MEPLTVFVDPVFLDREVDQFIDDYLETHPDATEFEAALMWAAELNYEGPAYE